MTKKQPLVSVLMPVYNASKYLEEALVSLQIQTHTNFELLAINDGSSDNSLEILKKYASLDGRIKIIDQDNRGIVAVLNRGLEEARGDYIARMDADDVSFPNRFSDQVKLLSDDLTTDLVCGNFEVIDEESQFLYRELVPPLDEDIQQALFVRNPIAHGSVMFRKSIIEKVGNYSDKFGPTEDLELWTRVAKVGVITGTGTPLYKWRVNSSGITMTNNSESIKRGKEHNEKRWEEVEISPITRTSLLKKSKYYLDTYPDFGHYYKLRCLDDRAQIATKLIRRGDISRGIKELFIISSTGRSGAKAVFLRLSLLFKIYSKKATKRGIK